MASEQKKTDTDLSKAMQNPLAEATKKTDVVDAISDADKTQKLAPNQISPQLDKFENWRIGKRKLSKD